MVMWPFTPTWPASTTSSSTTVLRRCHLGGQQGVAADLDPVPDLDEVVDLRPAAMRVSPRAGRSIATSAPISTSSSMTSAPCWGSSGGFRRTAGEAEPVAADHRPVLHHHPVAEHHALAQRRLRVNHAVGPDGRPGADGHMGMDDRPRSDGGARSDRYEGADGDAVSHLRVGRNVARRVNAGRRGRGVGEQLDGRANARYGSAVRSIGHGAAGASSARITAAARVDLSAVAYRGLAKKVRSPASAVSMPATPRISTPPSPSSRQSSRSATSRSFKTGKRITRPERRRRRYRVSGSVTSAAGGRGLLSAAPARTSRRHPGRRSSRNGGCSRWQTAPEG